MSTVIIIKNLIFSILNSNHYKVNSVERSINLTIYNL